MTPEHHTVNMPSFISYLTNHAATHHNFGIDILGKVQIRVARLNRESVFIEPIQKRQVQVRT